MLHYLSQNGKTSKLWCYHNYLVLLFVTVTTVYHPSPALYGALYEVLRILLLLVQVVSLLVLCVIHIQIEAEEECHLRGLLSGIQELVTVVEERWN